MSYITERPASLKLVEGKTLYGITIDEHGRADLPISFKSLEEVDAFKAEVKGANVNAKTEIGTTALMYAARSNDIGLVEELLDKGADVKACTIRDQTVLTYGIATGNAKIVNLLLKRGADPLVKDKDGDTALKLARKSGYIEIETLLLKHGAKE